MLFKKPKNIYQSPSYNLETTEFLRKNSISIVDIPKITERIIEPKDIDSVLEEKVISTEEVSTTISIADILGYDSPRKRDIFESISEFFDNQKDGYHKRSIGMLNYTPDNIMSGLASAFITEPIKVREVEPGRCFISGNGMHRFTILRIMYLIEKYRGTDIEKLREKYTIPVILNKVDKIKTYCSYLISVFYDNIHVYSEIDKDHHKTDKVEVINSATKTESVLTDEELIIYTTELLRDINLDIPKLLSLSKHVEKSPSFYEFLNTYFKDLLIEIERFIDYKNSCTNPLDLHDYKTTKKEDSSTWTL